MTLALSGAALSLLVPVLGLRSDSCGGVSCGLVQVIGKAMASSGVALALGTVGLASVRAGRFSAGALALLIAGPALLWTVMIVDDWRQLQAGTDEASQVIALAREYAASQRKLPPDQLRGLIVNGRGGWMSVRIAEPGQTELVLLQREAGSWKPRAIAPAFTKEELRALGAPPNVTEADS